MASARTTPQYAVASAGRAEAVQSAQVPPPQQSGQHTGVGGLPGFRNTVAPSMDALQSAPGTAAQPTRSPGNPTAPASLQTGSPGNLNRPPAQSAGMLRREAEAETGGWVSNLLRRASEDEVDAPLGAARRVEQPHRGPAHPATDQRSPLHVVESLNSLSMDIARAIDHEASVELWDRYQRGERDVFTRRLYTLKGQQTFDEIRGKYQREREFRTAVDRYIEDFEKLLKDVGKSDRDNIMSQTYLTSDTGKVYTMLAHASGRLGNH